MDVLSELFCAGSDGNPGFVCGVVVEIGFAGKVGSAAVNEHVFLRNEGDFGGDIGSEAKSTRRGGYDREEESRAAEAEGKIGEQPCKE
jgi:hypothetical protein